MLLYGWLQLVCALPSNSELRCRACGLLRRGGTVTKKQPGQCEPPYMRYQ